MKKLRQLRRACTLSCREVHVNSSVWQLQWGLKVDHCPPRCQSNQRATEAQDRFQQHVAMKTEQPQAEHRNPMLLKKIPSCFSEKPAMWQAQVSMAAIDARRERSPCSEERGDAPWAMLQLQTEVLVQTGQSLKFAAAVLGIAKSQGFPKRPSVDGNCAPALSSSSGRGA